MNDKYAASDEFNWVKARIECSPAKVFQHLKLEVESDVKSRNSIIPETANWKFDTVSQGGYLTVFINGRVSAKPSVVFAQTDVGIAVRDDKGTVLYDATLTLNDERQCRLKLNGKECESWHLRKLALEDLFFGDPWHSL